MDLLIENFKGIKSFKYNNIKPITILSGTNSGGKTSLIQSILLLKQSSEFGTPDMPIVLNGKYTRLGSLVNTVHKGEKDIKIELTTNLDDESIKSNLFPFTRYIKDKERIIKKIIKNEDTLNPQAVNYDDLYSPITSFSYKLVIGRKNNDEFPRIKEAHITLYTENGRNHLLKTSNYNNKNYHVSINSPLFLDFPAYFYFRKDDVYPEFPQKFGILEEIFKRNQSMELHDLKNEKIVFPGLRMSEPNDTKFLINRVIEEERHNKVLDLDFTSLISSLSLKPFDKVEFIGPLREEPKSLYLKESDIITDVGIKGENAGFIFANNNQNYVECPIVDESSKRVTSKNMTLESAVNYWINDKFKLAKSITVNKYKNNNIYEIEVTNFKNIKTSISSVGFGISQIFPIIVSSLISKDDTLLIFEQPEIHLHPAVQSLLFDFIYSLSKTSPSKKIFVETHSDHLINKYRIYKIEQPNEIDESTSVFFTDPQHSTLKSINFDQYGSLEEWPEGFFDQSAIDNKYIFEKQLEKKLNESIEKTRRENK